MLSLYKRNKWGIHACVAHGGENKSLIISRWSKSCDALRLRQSNSSGKMLVFEPAANLRTSFIGLAALSGKLLSDFPLTVWLQQHGPELRCQLLFKVFVCPSPASDVGLPLECLRGCQNAFFETPRGGEEGFAEHAASRGSGTFYQMLFWPCLSVSLFVLLQQYPSPSDRISFVFIGTFIKGLFHSDTDPFSPSFMQDRAITQSLLFDLAHFKL